ncbi:DUF6276 family protein [Halococcus saccharolyticus]|uniref:Small CPxCG-related zinc finger protein n=1 Tax=Halococcus saccharolyticus DSM 5350 TaxID=1227455 RepID=M0MDI9_9EURY|nr:DUF6276 family protein [Halococcus saccharolyticus]EMA42455.1 hypothetical protein C449_17072 [Halococcus saccharolyticus DSM 5350]
MDCPNCDSETVAFAVPDDLHEYVPGDETRVALCTHCLTLHPVMEADTASTADFTRVSDAFPTTEAAVPMALAVGLLDSFAVYRSEIEALLQRVERAGADPLLVLDRLASNRDLDPQVDLERRRKQLESVRE